MYHRDLEVMETDHGVTLVPYSTWLLYPKHYCSALSVLLHGAAVSG